MKSILVKEPGGAEQLFLGEAPKPIPHKNEILIKVKAAALNRMDILQREGRYPIPEGASEILGVDVAGVVDAVGKQVAKWKVGDRVMTLLDGGGYAEFAVVHEDLPMPMPDKFSFAEAASLPEVFLTAYQVLFLIGHLKPHKRVLIHAGASGVGTAAIQLCRAVDAIPIVTTSSEEKIEFCTNIGAQAGINYKNEDFAERVLELTQGSGVDIIMDFVGADYWQKNWQCLAREGHLIIIAYLSGSQVPQVDLREIQRKWASVTGTTLRSRSLQYKINLVKKFSDFSLIKFHTGQLKPIVDKIYDWQDVRSAHLYMETNKNRGKIILTGM